AAGGNLIAGERLSARRIDQPDRARREVAAPHRVGRNGGVLIEKVVRLVAGVIELKGRTPVGVGVDAGDFQRSPKRPAESVLRDLRFGARHIGAQLIRRRIEGRSAERVSNRSLVRLLAARTAAAEKKAAAPAGSPAAAARAAETSATEAVGPLRWLSNRRAVLRPEAWRDLSGRRIELPGGDALYPIVQESAVEVRRVIPSGDCNRVRLGVLDREAGRQQPRDVFGLRRRYGLGRCRAGVVGLHVQR